ncbi:MAG: RNA polymerase sigma factor SigJ [Labilithrix sp.]|nr:RNA polymerase sigma factor SigJ [Labilithrix sp.]MBX3210423.1 RNA polymerase sigma factor SigJ [Labilithrix sp.]
MGTFEEHRRYLFAIAYRMLGSAADADDMVQEAYVRWEAAAATEIRSPRAFLATVVSRLCLDRLKDAHASRVDYVGPWLPEPIRTEADDAPDVVAAAESISQAFLVLLESLTPLERAVHLLHEVFDYSHDEIAGILDRDAATCRKLLERARKDIVARRPRFAPSKETHRALVGGFAAAVVNGDVAALERLLVEDVHAVSDGGGKASAARKPVVGRAAVAKFYGGLARLAVDGSSADIVEVNGWPAMVVRVNGAVFAVIQVETDGAAIYAVRSTLNPDKLSRI